MQYKRTGILISDSASADHGEVGKVSGEVNCGAGSCRGGGGGYPQESPKMLKSVSPANANQNLKLISHF